MSIFTGILHASSARRQRKKTACRKVKAISTPADDIFERLEKDKQKLEKEKQKAAKAKARIGKMEFF